MYDITALGEILIDFTYQGIGRNGQKLFAQNPGGAPANALTSAARFGAKTAFLGKAGTDMHGRFLKEILEKEQIDTRGFILDERYFTTLAFVDLSPEGERTFSFARKPGADTQITEKELDMEILGNTKIFHVGSLSLTSEPARSTTFAAIKAAKSAGAVISYDPNYRATLWENVETAKREMKSLIRFVDIMKISDEETELLTDEKEPEQATKVLLEKGVKLVAVTLGKDGSYIANAKGGKRVPGFESNVVDTTGAGDAFWGTFLYKLSQSNESIEKITLDMAAEYAGFANAAASLCVENFGGIPSMPLLADVEKRMKMK